MPAPSGNGKPCILIGPHVDTAQCSPKPCAVDGQWEPWSAWSTCVPDCKEGKQKRSRTCTAPLHGGKDCADKEKAGFEESLCKDKILPCPIHGGYAPWEQWSACSATCGNGFHERKRLCNNPEPKYGGKPCEGSQNEAEVCLKLLCTTLLPNATTTTTK